MRLQNLPRDFVVLRHGAVHAEYYRLFFRRKKCSAYRALHALNADMRPVNHVRHDWDDITKSALKTFSVDARVFIELRQQDRAVDPEDIVPAQHLFSAVE